MIYQFKKHRFISTNQIKKIAKNEFKVLVALIKFNLLCNKLCIDDKEIFQAIIKKINYVHFSPVCIGKRTINAAWNQHGEKNEKKNLSGQLFHL